MRSSRGTQLSSTRTTHPPRRLPSPVEAGHAREPGSRLAPSDYVRLRHDLERFFRWLGREYNRAR
jgi:hypothetical protein